MYFRECERLVETYPDLEDVIRQVDAQLQEMGTAEVIRIADFASFLGADPNQVTSVFEMLAQERVLLAEELVECPHCRMAVLRSEYEDVLDEEGDYCCTDCERPLSHTTAEIITTYRRGEHWEEDETEDADQEPVKNWPDPCKHTTAKSWTLENGTFCISTKTNGQHDGKVEFPLNENGSPTYQMQFMRLICFQHPKPVLLRDVMEQVYPEEFASMENNPITLLRKVRSLVSDIRTKKFAKAGLNQNILPPLSFESSVETGISLQLAKLHRQDDKAVDDDASHQE